MHYTEKLKTNIRRRAADDYVCGALRTDIPGLTLNDQIDLYYVYLQQKTQARYRNEEWDFDFQDWLTLWGENWNNRGRKPEQYCMTRIDNTKGWSSSNAVVKQRKQFLSDASRVRNRGPWSEEQKAKGRQTRAANKGEEK